METSIQSSNRPVEHSRENWIQATQFHPFDNAQVLKAVCDRITSHPRRPVVLLDLDSTLYNPAPRSFQILQEWVRGQDAGQFPLVETALQQMNLAHVGYSIKDTFVNLGLNWHTDPQVHLAWRSAKDFWTERFFSNEYVSHDEPYAHASGVVQEFYKKGAEIVYLTGRDEPSMGIGTRRVLERDGFPVDPKRVRYLLKQQRDHDDHVHKMNSGKRYQGQDSVVASFENEPRNIVVLQDLLPEAMHVFVETHCSDYPARALRGVYRINGYVPVSS